MYITVEGFFSDIKKQDPGAPDHFHKMRGMVLKMAAGNLIKCALNLTPQLIQFNCTNIYIAIFHLSRGGTSSITDVLRERVGEEQDSIVSTIGLFMDDQLGH